MIGKKYLLVLGCDLSEDGNNLGPQTIVRLIGAEYWASRRSFSRVAFCFTAGYSPKHPEQVEPMASMMATWMKVRHPKEEVVEIGGTVDFNTRGELGKFVIWAEEQGIPFDDLAISSAWWHIRPRVRDIFADMFGDKAAEQVTFVPTAAEFTLRNRVLEVVKRRFARLPASWRKAIYKLVRRTSFNPSW